MCWHEGLDELIRKPIKIGQEYVIITAYSKDAHNEINGYGFNEEEAREAVRRALRNANMSEDYSTIKIHKQDWRG